MGSTRISVNIKSAAIPLFAAPQFLEHELKQSYTTKNFTLKSGLLELEKQYRAHMNVDPAMAAFWADVTVLLVSRFSAVVAVC